MSYYECKAKLRHNHNQYEDPTYELLIIEITFWTFLESWFKHGKQYFLGERIVSNSFAISSQSWESTVWKASFITPSIFSGFSNNLVAIKSNRFSITESLILIPSCPSNLKGI